MKRELLISIVIAFLVFTTPTLAGIAPPDYPWYTYYGMLTEDGWVQSIKSDGSFDTESKVLTMENNYLPDCTKYLWLHLTLDVTPNGPYSFLWNDVYFDSLTPTPAYPTGTSHTITIRELKTDHLLDEYEHTLDIWAVWKIYPQPESETINLFYLLKAVAIETDRDIDDRLLVMECKTVCSGLVPEPSCLMLLATGIVFLKRSKS